MLVAELAAAGPDELVAALILVKGDWRPALIGERASALPGDAALATLIARARSGAAPEAGWKIELYPELGALYVRAPAAALARLLMDPGVASATLPDEGP